MRTSVALLWAPDSPCNLPRWHRPGDLLDELVTRRYPLHAIEEGYAICEQPVDSRCARDGRVNVVLRFVPLSWRYTVIVCDTVSAIDIPGPPWDCDR
jgi:hypothetical protein